MSDNSPTKSPNKPKSANKSSKTKGPVDVERQCGVLKDGVPCARSLTCKSHSMGAKRAVPGRSLPYDMLLSQYQKKNQAKQQSKFLFFLSTLSPYLPRSITTLPHSHPNPKLTTPQKQQLTPTPPSKTKNSPTAPSTPTKSFRRCNTGSRNGTLSPSSPP
jgi:hypothetical protein